MYSGFELEGQGCSVEDIAGIFLFVPESIWKLTRVFLDCKLMPPYVMIACRVYTSRVLKVSNENHQNVDTSLKKKLLNPVGVYVLVGLCGLGVTCSLREPRFAGWNPTEVHAFFLGLFPMDTKKYHVFAPLGRFQLELIYLYFPPSSLLVYLCFCPVGLSLL